MQPPDVHQLAGRAVRLAGVEGNAPLIADDVADHGGEVANGEVLAGTNIDVRQHWLGNTGIGLVAQLHDMEAGLRHIVHVKEFTHRSAGSPNQHLRGSALLRLVKPPEQAWNHVTVLRVVVISRTVQVCWHDAAIVSVSY